MRFFYKIIFTTLLLCAALTSRSEEFPTIIPEVAVTAPIHGDENNEAQTTTISHKKIAQTPSPSLEDLLKSQSVVRVTNNSGNSYQSILSLRGFGDNAEANSLILVDGFPLINSSLLAPNFNAILLSDIQNINIEQGSRGSLWGNQAVGGVMDIHTQHPMRQAAQFNVGYGSYNQKLINGSYSDKLANGFFYKLLAFGSQTNNYRPHNYQSDTGLNAQQGWDYTQGSVAINEKISNDSVQFPGLLTQTQYDQNPRQASDTQDYIHYRTQTYQLLNKQALNNDWWLETRASTNSAHSFGFFMGYFSDTDTLNWLNPQLIGMVGQNKLTLGYVGEKSNYKAISANFNSSLARTTENDLYAQSVIPVFKKWDLTLGARGAWQNNDPQLTLGQQTHYSNQVFVTEQGMQWHFNPDWEWFIRRDGNFRFPKTNEEVWLPTNVTELKPQTGTSYETGLQWHTHRQTSKLSVYQLNLHNEIAYNPMQTPEQPFGATNNFAATLRRGFTLSEEFSLKKNIDLATQLNYVDARFSGGPFKHNLIPAVPAWAASAGIADQFATHWRASFNELYTGTAIASNDVANVGTRANINWLSQCALQYFYKFMVVNLEVNNVFNRRFAVYTIYNQSTQSDFYAPGAGRNYVLSFKASMA